jgi:hypothetical protein
MEIQPQPFVSDEIIEEKSIAIPNEGSKIVSVSPTSLDNINIFSASPVSQVFKKIFLFLNYFLFFLKDLLLRASPKFIVGSGGHSFSSVGAIAATSGTKSDPTATTRSRNESPPTSNSFPERNSIPHQRVFF